MPCLRWNTSSSCVIHGQSSRCAAVPNARIHLWLHDLMAPGSTRARWLAGADAALATAGGR